MKRWLLLWFLLLGWETARAEEKKFSFLFTDNFTYQKNRLANPPDQFLNDSSLFLKYGSWAGGLTLRGYNYYRQAPNYTLQDSKADLHRKYIQYARPNFEFQAGDFYSILGRGLVLSVLQNEKAYRERTLFGGDLGLHSKNWKLRMLGGRVEDELQMERWRVAGAEVSREHWKGNRVGLNASYIHDSKTFMDVGDRLTWSIQWNADALPGGFSYYAEIGRLKIDDAFRPDGSGCYANVGWTREKVTLLLEFKKYRDFDNGLNNPPSADRGDEAVDLADSETLRLYAQYSFFNPDIIAFLSIGRARDSAETGPQIYTGANGSEIGGRLDFSFGYSFKETYYPGKIVDGQATLRLTSTVAAGFAIRDKRFSQGEYRFNERDWMPQISWAPYGSVFFGRQYSHAPIDGHHHFNSYGFRINIKRDSYFEFSTGRTRGGEVCAAGQCFYMPPFRGWKIGILATVR